MRRVGQTAPRVVKAGGPAKPDPLQRASKEAAGGWGLKSAVRRSGLGAVKTTGTVDARSAALAARLVTAGGTGTAEDVAVVVAELSKMPLSALQQMQAVGMKVIACRGSVTDYLSNLKGVAPRGWPPGATWDNVPGTFYENKKQVIIATMPSGVGEGRKVPATGVGHNSANLVLHETGHGLDAVSGDRELHLDDAFQEAYTADVAAMADYYKQAGEAGLEEAFAETFALFVSGDPVAKQRYPHLMAYWQEHWPFAGAEE